MSDHKEPWQSKLLQGLGVKSAAIETPRTQRKGLSLALAAAVSIGLSGVSLGASAEEPIKKETPYEAASTTAYSVIGIEDGDSGVERTGKVAATIGQIAMSPQAGLVSLVGQVAVGSTTGATTKSSSKGMHAAELVGTAAGVAVAAPVLGVLMVANQAHNTYLFIQDEREKAVKLKLEEVADRVAGVKASYAQQLRMDDRIARQAWPEDRKAYDQKTMYEAAVDAERANMPLSDYQQGRYDIEVQIAASGGETEPWYSKFSVEKQQIASARDAQIAQMLADAQDISQEQPFESITSRIQISAAKGTSELPHSNKGFADFAKDEARRLDKNSDLTH